MHGAAQVTVKLAAPVSGFIGSLNVAVTALSSATPVAPLTGTAVSTVGGAAVAPSVPKMGVRLPLHPAISAHSNIGMNHVGHLLKIFAWRISIPS
jgi:hypothetical protein